MNTTAPKKAPAHLKGREVITITPTGGIYCLHSDTGTPVIRLGQAEVDRVSDLVWEPGAQAFTVQFKEGRGPLAGRPVRVSDLVAAGVVLALPAMVAPPDTDPCDGIALYRDRRLAVAAEIALVQAAQLRGEIW